MGMVRKALLFGLFGGLGCLVGAAVGEVVLWSFGGGENQASSDRPSVAFSPEFDRRLEREGATAASVQVSLLWNNFNDLDLHAIEPDGERIYFNDRRSRSGGELDVDMNATGPESDEPVENIYWDRGDVDEGVHRIFVHHYANHGSTDPTHFRVAIRHDDVAREFEGSIASSDAPILMYEFTLDPLPEEPDNRRQLLIMAALWIGCLGVGLALALVVGQSWYLGQGWPHLTTLLPAGLGALAAGAFAGFVAQFLLSAFGSFEIAVPVIWVLAWCLLGGLVGIGMSFVVRNLAIRRAGYAGVVGGLAGGLGFLFVSAGLGLVLGRFAGASILGFAVGLTVVVAEVASRIFWLDAQSADGSSRQALNLGAKPISIGSHRGSVDLYVDGVPSVALQYRVEGDVVRCDDKRSGQDLVVEAGHEMSVGDLRLVVRRATGFTAR